MRRVINIIRTFARESKITISIYLTQNNLNYV